MDAMYQNVYIYMCIYIYICMFMYIYKCVYIQVYINHVNISQDRFPFIRHATAPPLGVCGCVTAGGVTASRAEDFRRPSS